MNVDTGELRKLLPGEPLDVDEVLVKGDEALVRRLSDNVQAGSDSELNRRVRELWAAHEERMARKALRSRAKECGLVLPSEPGGDQ